MSVPPPPAHATHFGFLQSEWPEVFEAAAKAEGFAVGDPRTACFYARRGLELAVQWSFAHDASLQVPYRDDLSAMLHEPSFKAAVGQTIFLKAKALKDLGNLAVHSQKPLRREDAVMAVRELFHVGFWLARTYSRGTPPPAGLVFDEGRLPRPSSTAAATPSGMPGPQTMAQLQRLEGELRARDEQLAKTVASRNTIAERLSRLREQKSQAEAAVESLREQLEEAREAATPPAAEIESLRAQVEAAREAGRSDAVRLESELAQLRAEAQEQVASAYRRQEDELARLREEARRAEREIAQLRKEAAARLAAGEPTARLAAGASSTRPTASEGMGSEAASRPPNSGTEAHTTDARPQGSERLPNTLQEDLATVRAQVAAAKKANAARPDTHDYDEASTRAYLVDLLLREAGWPLDRSQDREFEVEGMPARGGGGAPGHAGGPEDSSGAPSRGDRVHGASGTAPPPGTGMGRVDYVLWGEDGRPLALIEAKRSRRDPRAGQQQARLYADCLERRYGRRPVIFYSNGYEHWIWDDASSPPRPVQGFYKRDELELLLQRRQTRKDLATAPVDAVIADRYYQERAIRRITEAFERDGDRKALVVMATGAGKTRTVIALAELLMRCNWAKRVLFLADRVALVNQAVNAFKRHLPDASPVNLVTDREAEGRVFASTYPTMMGLIEERTSSATGGAFPSAGDGRRFGVGHFDLVIIDEAHRSVFRKYRAIFDYFDALLVGLTATPKEELDRNTYGLFDLEPGVPTDAYTLDEAVSDGFLVPPQAVSVPLRFQREGIRYDELSEEERDAWDALEWDEEDGTPEQVDAGAVNRWLFNKDTVDKVLEHLMTRGLAVAGGDRLGKTIVFAKNNAHAEFIAERFDANYPHLKGEFARVITFKTEYAQSLIDAFSQPDRAPHVAISVDMLDTGIDVPEVVNLVLFKLVRSRTKFHQMLGRGTRLRPDLFGPGRHKEFFYVFDFCQNLEFFSLNPEATEGAAGESLSRRLFKARLALLAELGARGAAAMAGDVPPELTTAEAPGRYEVEEAPGRHEVGEAPGRHEVGEAPGRHEVGEAPENDAAAALWREIANQLLGEVSAMDVENFVVRPQRRLVEQFREAGAWERLAPEALAELGREVAGLPTTAPPEPEEAKRFDLLMLRLQLERLRGEEASGRLRDQVVMIAGALEEKATIPMVKEQLPLLLELQTEAWWQDATPAMAEEVRKRVRGLVRLVERKKRLPLYTDFEDRLGEEVVVDLPGFAGPDAFALFRAKARAFLRQHQDLLAIRKLRMNRPLTTQDLAELERILLESGTGGEDALRRAAEEAEGLGIFVRSLVGLDREAAKQELAGFLAGKTPTASQIEFMNMVVDHLTEHGVMAPALLYESPFTDLSPQGPDGIFSEPQLDALFAALDRVRAAAVAS